MLHYDSQHVSSSTLLILRRTNCIITASGIVTLCTQPYSMQVESGLLYCSLFSAAFCVTFLFAGIATSVNMHVFCFLFLSIISDQFALSSLSVCTP